MYCALAILLLFYNNNVSLINLANTYCSVGFIGTSIRRLWIFTLKVKKSKLECPRTTLKIFLTIFY